MLQLASAFTDFLCLWSVTRGGKSTLCQHLCDNFPNNSVVVEMDQYYWVSGIVCSFAGVTLFSCVTVIPIRKSCFAVLVLTFEKVAHACVHSFSVGHHMTTYPVMLCPTVPQSASSTPDWLPMKVILLIRCALGFQVISRLLDGGWYYASSSFVSDWL